MARQRIHDPRRHAAVRTDEYLFSQLIPYIGNKRKLLHLIAGGLEMTGLRRGTFVDLFTGSTVVARFAKKEGFRVVANDWEPYSYEIAHGTVALNERPTYERLGLGDVDHVFEALNNLPPRRGYIATHLCPADDENPDLERERLFFTRENGERIDAIREQVAMWESEGKLDPHERAYILASLVYAASYASNTSGVFKGFHRGWGGKTGTALYRIRGRLEIRPPILFDNHERNLATQEDATLLVEKLPKILGARPDVVYLDPPYNQHPYGSNYHVLTTIALWDKPDLSPSVIVDGETVDKSAIRKDWRTERRSQYNSESKALPAFADLIDRIDARWIMLSYSTDGNMALSDALSVLAERGELELIIEPYKRYRVSTPRMSTKSHNVEVVAVVDTEGKASSNDIGRLVDEVLTAEDAVLSGNRGLDQGSLFE